MNVRLIRTVFGIGLIITHLVAIGYAFIGLRPVLRTEQSLELALIMTPIFAVHTTAAISFFTQHMHDHRRGRSTNPEFAIVAFLIATAFVTFAFGSLIAFRAGWVESFDMLKQLVAGTEILFGGYLGLLMEKLFPKQIDVQRT